MANFNRFLILSPLRCVLAPADNMSNVNTRSRSNSKDDGDISISEKLDKMFSEMRAFREETLAMGTSINSTHEKIDELKVIFNEHRVDIDKCLGDVDELKTENMTLKKELNSVRTQLCDLQQYSRRNVVDIQGVPEVASENVLKLVQSVARCVRFELKPEMVDAVHRLSGPTNDKSRPRGIILKLVRRVDCDELLRLAKVKRGFSASELGFTSENKVFLNPSLCKAKSELLFLARKAVKDGIVKFGWYQNGKILVRRAVGQAAINIVSREQLQLMYPQRQGAPSGTGHLQTPPQGSGPNLPSEESQLKPKKSQRSH